MQESSECYSSEQVFPRFNPSSISRISLSTGVWTNLDSTSNEENSKTKLLNFVEKLSQVEL
ncbi:MAG: hypothetical protein PUP92_15145 [Rhizonema sp. PD38]|nr:hypothetical protein [Rhizonema sp. PD38]